MGHTGVRVENVHGRAVVVVVAGGGGRGWRERMGRGSVLRSILVVDLTG